MKLRSVDECLCCEMGCSLPYLTSLHDGRFSRTHLNLFRHRELFKSLSESLAIVIYFCYPSLACSFYKVFPNEYVLKKYNCST